MFDEKKCFHPSLLYHFSNYFYFLLKIQIFLDLGELESGLSRISLANSMSNPSAFPPLPGASNSPTPENNGGDHTAARNEEKSKQASLTDR